jgi:hypothetical protein
MRRSGLGATLGLEVKQGQHEGHGQGEGMLGAGYRAGVPGPAGPGRRFHRFQSNTNAEYLQMEERKVRGCRRITRGVTARLWVAIPCSTRPRNPDWLSSAPSPAPSSSRHHRRSSAP